MSLKRTVTFPQGGSTRRKRSNRVNLKLGRYRSVNNKQHIFKRSVTVTHNINAANGWDSSGYFDLAYNFTLSGVNVYVHGASSMLVPLSGFTEISYLFDQYKISNIRCQMFYSYNSASNSSTGRYIPLLHIANDYNDSISSFTNDSLSQYSNCRTVQLNTAGSTGNGAVNHNVKPKVAASIYNGVYNAYTEKTSFIDTVYTAVPHYGMKIFWDTMNISNDLPLGAIEFRFTYDIIAKNIR